MLGCQPNVPTEPTDWIMHSRVEDAVGTDSASRALELATVKIGTSSADRYRLLDLYAESGRTVAVARFVGPSRSHEPMTSRSAF